MGAINSSNGLTRIPFWDALRSAVWRGVQAGLFALLVALVNPFQITHWEEMRSHEVWERFHAPLLSPPDQRARGAVSIVSLNEDTLAKLGLTRPLDMATHGEILSDIIEAPVAGNVTSLGGAAPAEDDTRPRAVFVDLILSQASAPNQPAFQTAATFLNRSTDACGPPKAAKPEEKPQTGPRSFLCYAQTVARYTNYPIWRADRNCQSDTLSKIYCIVKNGGIPILFADETRGRETGAFDSRPPAIRLLDEVAVAVPVFISLPDYPLFEHSRDQGGQEMRFVRPADGERIRLTPASALYAAYCMKGPEDCFASPTVKTANPPTTGDRLELSSRFEEPLDLQWASGAPADAFTPILHHLHPGAMTQDCSSSAGLLTAGARFLEMVLAGVHLGASVPDCPYVHDLPYQDLSAGAFSVNDASVALGGKLVLIGEEFRDSPDVVNAAPNRALPGVYAHAMALVRLVANGEKYPRSPHPFTPWFDFNTVDLGIVLTVFVFFFFDHLLSLTLGHPRHHAEASGHPQADFIRRPRWLRSWLRLTIRLIFPLLIAGAIWWWFPRHFELSIVVVGGLVVAMVSEIAVGSLLRWLGKRGGRFANLWADLRAIFAAPPTDTSEPAPTIHQHRGGNV